MKRLLLLMLLSFAGTWVSAAEDCFDRIARDKGLDADLLRATKVIRQDLCTDLNVKAGVIEQF